MVSGSWAWTSIGKPKSVGRLPLTSCQVAPESSVRITSQCFCMYSVFGRDGCMAMRWTQCPTSAVGSGMNSECSPLLIGVQVFPSSSVRKVPAAEIAMYIRPGLVGSSRIVCRPSPPAPGIQPGAEGWLRRLVSSCQLLPPSVVRNMAASSTPAYTVSGSVSEGSRCQTRVNFQGFGVPSYQRWVPVSPS
jgi:hypothetical protein